MKKAKNLSLCGGGGGEFLNRSTESTAPHLDTSECTTKEVELTKASPVEDVLSLRASEGCVAIQPIERICHAELDSASDQQKPEECNACEIPNRVRNDNFTGLLRRYAPRNDDKVCSTLNELATSYSLLTTKIAFTMAEILLSLTIIGVVAAITLPSLTGNINERTWNTQRKALYARFSQAIALMPALNGYGTLDATDSHKVTETFITNGLSKVLKINNICADNLQDCGFPAQLSDANGTKITTPSKISELYSKNTSVVYYTGVYSGTSVTYADINAVAFETANGESILAFYNPNCNSKNVLSVEDALMIPEKMCANFVYDLNGKKGPNTFGKDIGIVSAFYPADSVVVAPLPHLRSGDLAVDFSTANSSCKDVDSELRAPNLEEMMALMYNFKIANLNPTRYWTNTRAGDKAWQVSQTNKALKTNVDATSGGAEVLSVRCIQR